VVEGEQEHGLRSWHTAAYTEAFLLTKEPAFANCVNDMND